MIRSNDSCQSPFYMERKSGEIHPRMIRIETQVGERKLTIVGYPKDFLADLPAAEVGPEQHQPLVDIPIQANLLDFSKSQL